MPSYRLSAIGPDAVPTRCAYADEPRAEGCWVFADLEAAVLASIYSWTQDGDYRPQDGYHHLQILEGAVSRDSGTGWAIAQPISMRVVDVSSVHEILAAHIGCEADELADEELDVLRAALTMHEAKILDLARSVAIRRVDTL